MSKTVCCIIARSVSSRLPLKVLRKIEPEHSMIGFIIERLKTVQSIDDIYLCTSHEDVDDIFEDIAEEHQINLYRGSPSQVTERMLSVADKTNADVLIRVTGDNVFTSVEYLDAQIQKLQENNLDYIRMTNVPLGATAEAIRVSALRHCHENMDPEISEYLMLFIFNPELYKCGVMRFSEDIDYSNFTLTVDLVADLVRTKEILNANKGRSIDIKLSEIMSIIDSEKVENCVYLPSGDVKLPYGKVVPFSEFKNDMNLRIAKAENYTVNEI
jgi:spore coat polysaccharide biosynthesis protein SpsF